MIRSLFLFVALWASAPAFAIDLAELTALDVTGQTTAPYLANANVTKEGTYNYLCLTRGIGSAQGQGAVGTLTVVAGKLTCKTTTAIGAGAQPTVYWANKAQFVWRAHNGGPTITSSAVRFGKHTSGTDVIPCRPKGGNDSRPGVVTTQSSGALRCSLGVTSSAGTVTLVPDFDVLIRKSRDGA